MYNKGINMSIKNIFSKTLLMLAMFSVVFALSANAQTKKQIKGTVKDATGMTLPGVSVQEKGTDNGVVTDADGNYNISASETATLVFSFIGMATQEVAVGGRNAINVVLSEDVEALDEVVVTALGIKREKKALGYAVTDVKGAEIAAANTVNPVEALQGKVAGLSIGQSDGGLFGGTKINIRGISTLGSNNQPIFVIDGIILDNNTSGGSEWSDSPDDWGNELKNLNADDFESVSVLKGSAATALYGSRGINGAVVITTKSGKGQKGLGITFKQTTGIDYVYDTPDIQYEFGGGTFPAYVNYGEKMANGQIDKWNTQQFYKDQDGNFTLAWDHWGWAYGPKFDGREVIDYDGTKTTYSGRPDNFKNMYDVGVSNNTTLSVTGGNDNTTFYISGSLVDRKGYAPNTSFSRNSLLLKGTHKLNKIFSIDASVSYAESNPKNTPRNFGAGYIDGGYFTNTYNSEKYKDKYTSEHGGVPNTNYGDKYGKVPGVGFWFGVHNSNTERVERVLRPIVKVSAKVTDWATINVEGNMNKYTVDSETKNLGGGYKNEGGYYRLENFSKTQKTGKVTLNLSHTYGDFKGNLMLGGEVFTTDEQKTAVWTDGGLIVPGQYFMGNSKKTPGREAYISGEKQLNSLYYMANISWKDQVYLDITGRKDWSSALVYTNGTGNYGYFYPSVSSSWIFTESFELPNWFSYGKLRASWAQVGNDTRPYSINDGYSIDNIEMNDGKFIYVNGYNRIKIDPDLKPERKTSISFGADLRFLNNRIGLDVAYYDESTKDQIIDIPGVSESGVDKMRINAGEIRNKGIEIALNTTPIKIKDFSWDLDLTYFKNKNEVVSLHDKVGEYMSLAGSPNYGNYRIGSVAYIGGEYGVLLSDSKPQTYQAVDADGKNVDHKHNGMKVLKYRDDRRGAYYIRKGGKPEKIGSMLPDFEGSISNTFRYKGFALNAMLDLRYGGYMASYSNRYGTAYGIMGTSLKYRDEANGGITWTTQYGDTKGNVYHDGLIPEGVFANGSTATGPDGVKRDIGGMTYKEAYDKGWVEPMHAPTWHYYNNSWGTGTVNDDWVSEIKYIGLRQVSLSYTFPNNMTSKYRIRNLSLSVVGRNLGYLYNSLPNNLNPGSTRGNRSDYSYFERTLTPYVASYSFTLKFNI